MKKIVRLVSEVKDKRCKPIKAENEHEIVIADSASEFARYLGVSNTQIYTANRNCKTIHGYSVIFPYTGEEDNWLVIYAEAREKLRREATDAFNKFVDTVDKLGISEANEVKEVYNAYSNFLGTIMDQVWVPTEE